MKSNTNKISIPRSVFEKTFFKNGGEKQVFKELTGEYQFPLDLNQKNVQPNAEIEGGEYVADSQGLRRAEGKTHEQGGMPVNLEEGTRILSDHLKIGVDVAKKIKDFTEIPVKATDTYAKVLDKYNKKLGLDKVNDRLENLMGMMKKESENKDKKTANLNIDFISKQLNAEAEKKKPLDKDREQLFNMLFKIQESTKEGEPEYKMQNGGEIQRLAAQYGISPERAAELAGLPKYQNGNTPLRKIEGQYVTGQSTNVNQNQPRIAQHATKSGAYGNINDLNVAVSELYRNFPDLVLSDQTLKPYLNVEGNKVSFKNNIALNKPQEAIGALQNKMQARMKASAEHVINNEAVYGKDAVAQAKDYLAREAFAPGQTARDFDKKFGNFTSGRYALQMNVVTPEDQKLLNENGIYTLKQITPDSPLFQKLSPESQQSIKETQTRIGSTDADFAIGQFKVGETPGAVEDKTKVQGPGITGTPIVQGAMVLPNRDINMPTWQPSLKTATRLNRIEPNLISPTQELQEQDRAVLAAQQDLENLSPEQRAAANIGLTANRIGASGKSIQTANRFNAAAQNTADVYNAQIGDKEQMAENQNALSYEARTLKGLANFDQDYQNMLNTKFSDQAEKWKYINMINAQNAFNPNVQYTGTGFETVYQPNLAQSNINYINQNQPKVVKGKNEVTDKKAVKKFGGRFKK